MSIPLIVSITDLGTTLELKATNNHYYIISKGEFVDIIYKLGRAYLTINGGKNNHIRTNQFEITEATTYNEESFDSIENLIYSLQEVIGSSSAGGSSSSVSAAYRSPVDFVAAYNSESTILLSNLPGEIIDSSQIVYIKIIPETEKASVIVNGSGGYTLRVANDIITAYYNEDVADIFAENDVYEVGLNLQDKAYDPTINVELGSQVTPIPQLHTDAEGLVSAQTLTGSYANFGSEIDVRGINRLGVFVVADVNASENVDLKIVGLDASGGTVYEIDGIDEVRLWTTGASDFNTYLEFDTGTLPYVRVQAKAGTAGSPAGTLTLKVNKKWRN
jgi:hypothetical protein